MSKKIVVVGFVLLLGGIFVMGNLRKNKLNKEGVKSVCKVIEIKKVGEGSRTLDSRAIYFSYQVGDKEFVDTDTYYTGVSVGDCYEIIYLPSNPRNVKANFKKPIKCGQD